MKQLLISISAYLIIVITIAVFCHPYLLKIKMANQEHAKRRETYLNLSLKKNLSSSSQEVTCSGKLLFTAQSPVLAMQFHQDLIYLSTQNGQLIIFDPQKPNKNLIYPLTPLTDFYSEKNDLYGTDILNDRVIKIQFSNENLKFITDNDKIGRANALTKDSTGNMYITGYSSGNITKIIGRDRFLFGSDLDQIVNMTIVKNQLYLARYQKKPSFIKINLNDLTQTIIDDQNNFSSLVSDGQKLWVVYQVGKQTGISKIEDDTFVKREIINCPFPVKIVFANDDLLYTSLEDSKGKIYSLNNNLQTTGK